MMIENVPDIYVREISTYLGLDIALFDEGTAKISMIDEPDVGRALITVLVCSVVTVLEYYPALDVIYLVVKETM